jgi:hypothetical protein
MSGLSPLTCPVWEIQPVATLLPAQLEDRLMTRKGLDARGDWRKQHDEDLHYINPNLILFRRSNSGKRDRRGFWHLRGKKKCTRGFDRKGRNHLDKLGVNRIIWILKKREVAEWASFI